MNSMRKSYQYLFFVFALALMLSLVSACTSSPIDLTNAQTITPHEGIVFGRVKVLADEKERENFSTIFGESTMSVIVLPDNSSQITYFPLTGTGLVFWHLPAGGNTIAGFKGLTTDFFSHLIKGRIFASFQVVPDTVTYIGTLTLTFQGNRYQKFVEDEYESAVVEFRKRFPQIKLEIRKKLMVMEKER